MSAKGLGLDGFTLHGARVLIPSVYDLIRSGGDDADALSKLAEDDEAFAADVDAVVFDRDGDTVNALQFAAAKGRRRCCKLLLVQLGASVDHQNSHGCTALGFAVQCGHLGVVSLLLGEHGLADPSLSVCPQLTQCASRR